MSKFAITENGNAIKLTKTFQALARNDINVNIILDAFKKAVKPVEDKARSLVPKGKTLNLYNSIQSSFARDELAIDVGAMKKFGYKGYHGLLIEEGTKQRDYVAIRKWVFKSPISGNFITVKPGDKVRTGLIRSTAPYTHFMRRAVMQTENQVTNIMDREFYNSVGSIFRKNGLR
jgi:hypothetical protein